MHEVAVSEKDKSLLAELIPEPGIANADVLEEGKPSAAGKNATMLPAVNCMNTPDCHWLPEDLLQYAKANGIELWAGGGGEGCGQSHNLIYSVEVTLADVAALLCFQIHYLLRICTIACKNSYLNFRLDSLNRTHRCSTSFRSTSAIRLIGTAALVSKWNGFLV